MSDHEAARNIEINAQCWGAGSEKLREAAFFANELGCNASVGNGEYIVVFHCGSSRFKFAEEIGQTMLPTV